MKGINTFIKAYMNCGTVTRVRSLDRTAEDTLHTIEGGQFRLVNQASIRVVEKPRDYIFATMAQFPWYNSPLNVNDVSFTDIFRDLYDQSSTSGHRFTPRILQSMTDPNAVNEDAWKPSDDQPDPACLGDFIKLIGRKIGPSPQLTGPPLQASLHATSPVSAKPCGNESEELVLRVIESAMNLSVQAWGEAHKGGELSKFGSFPEEDWVLGDFDAVRCGWRAKSSDPQFKFMEHEDGSYSMSAGRVEYEEIPEWFLDVLFEDGPAINRPAQGHYVTLFQQARKILDHM